MTPEKQKQKLQGQSSIAQKVFQYVPIQDAWTAGQISGSLTASTRSRVDPTILRGCLEHLRESGLIRKMGSTFQRVAITSPPTFTQQPKEPIVTKTEKPSTSAIDLLSVIAQKLRDVAQDIEAAALAIEDGQAKKDQEAAKFKQLQALLKDMA